VTVYKILPSANRSTVQSNSLGMPPTTRSGQPASIEEDITDSASNTAQAPREESQPTERTLAEILARLTDAVTQRPAPQPLERPASDATDSTPVRHPDKFTGVQTNNLRPFLAQCRMVFMANLAKYRSDRKRYCSPRPTSIKSPNRGSIS
jgi:hypothetical protein